MFTVIDYSIETGHRTVVQTFANECDATALCLKECCNSERAFYVQTTDVQAVQAPGSDVVHGTKNGKSVLCLGVLYRRTRPVDKAVNCSKCLTADLPF